MTGRRTIGRVAAATALATGLVALGPGEPPALATDGDITTYVDPGGLVAAPQDITAGPDGNLWFTASQTRIGRIDPDDGTITTYTDPESEVDNPAGITAGPDGNLWFTNVANDRIGRIDPDDGTITTYTDPLGNVDGPIAITAGPDGNLWFVDALNARVGKIDPDDGSITTFALSSAGADIAAGPDGNLWITRGNGLTRVTPAGVTTDYTDPDNEIGSLRGLLWLPGELLMVTDPGNDQLWFVKPSLGLPDPFVAPITGAGIDQPTEIVLAGGGTQIWWANRGNHTIARLVTDDLGDFVAEPHADPMANVANPQGLTVGPDGDLWFTAGTTRIGRYEVDVTGPDVTITTPQDGAVFTRGQVVNADFACTDPDGLEIVSCGGTVMDGTPIDTSTVGSHGFDAVAEDHFLNATTVHHDYSVVAPKCAGHNVTVMLSLGDEPTFGPDVILGTPGPDTIDADTGADIICGQGGADTIVGRGGNDRAYGGDGNDMLTGFGGADTLYGGAGNDRLTGGTGTDRLVGSTGRDTCSGGQQRDTQSGCEVRTSIP